MDLGLRWADAAETKNRPEEPSSLSALCFYLLPSEAPAEYPGVEGAIFADDDDAEETRDAFEGRMS